METDKILEFFETDNAMVRTVELKSFSCELLHNVSYKMKEDRFILLLLFFSSKTY